MIDLAAKLKLNESFVWEPMPDGCILYSQSSGQIITLNPVTELMLSFFDGETSLDQVYTALQEDAPMDQSVFGDTVDKLMAEKVLLPADV